MASGPVQVAAGDQDACVGYLGYDGWLALVAGREIETDGFGQMEIRISALYSAGFSSLSS
jgi:hypothetical protein